MRERLLDYCNRLGWTTIIEQWDMERNAPLTPADVSHGSRKKVWWKCREGHSWQASIYSRSGDTEGCPYCAGRRHVQGTTDLAALHPELAAQWAQEENGALTPADVSVNSSQKVWWRCEKGHLWQAQIRSRTSGSNCPVCANRVIIAGENDLASRYPDLAAEWNAEKNGGLQPVQVAAASNRKVWWRCVHGHEWEAKIYSRTIGKNGCPVCAGKILIPGINDLATNYPQIAAEWHPTLNEDLTPKDVMSFTGKRVWWQCERGHAYQAAISLRSGRNRGCPYCVNKKVLPGFNDLATLEPSVAAEWHPTLNGNTTPDMVTCGSQRKAWWICSEGHVWNAVISSRAASQKCGCPVCAGKVRKNYYHRYQVQKP